ncbi:MAG: undecaprenyl-phosphate glucose phosphotransferase [Gammaproteobacteria bacterium]|nr:undecaprenyl-phosphate glucose phosphotransferase [Gammaproteobacteria bacterium]
MDINTCLGRSTPTFIPVLQHVIDPFITVISLFLIASVYSVPFDEAYQFMAIIAFLLALIIFREVDLHRCWRKGGVRAQSSHLLVAWLLLVGILLFLGYVTKSSEHFSRRVLTTWFVIAPVLILAGHAVTQILIRRFYATEKNTASVVIAGVSDIGRRMARQITEDAHLGMSLKGFFDDRNSERLALGQEEVLLGHLGDVAGYVGAHKIDRIYIALPMMQERRITKLLEDLRDTTASIYFIPDIFIFDLIQARMSEVNGIPVVSVCETPFYGVRALLKRLSDVVVASIVLLLTSPLLALIALCIKWDSPGSILFKQRRYGLDGEEIVVYKFRTMTVCEDSGEIIQATRNDVRITRFGAFLRRTSLDELPQFINVLQGRMSVVGPRPHAVAHNELYRKVIRGYMVRHKVRPGITGWAQVNGLRGETETLEKMQERIDYDLDYLRHWSVLLDIRIILRTAFLMFRDRRAY